MKLSEGQTVANGKYTLIRALGKGAQGEVWEAQQQSHEGFVKLIVLKFLLIQQKESLVKSASESRRMFLNEARLAAKLQHPNIVEIYDLGQEGVLDFIAMECIQGKDLELLLLEHLKTHQKPLRWEIATQKVQ